MIMRIFCSLLVSLFATVVFASSPQIIDYTSKITFGYQSEQARNIDVIVIHSTYCIDGDPYNVEHALAVFRQYKVASHYLIDRHGTIYRLVAEKDIAYQAGKSILPQNGRKMLNSSSIGIELLNTPTEPPTDLQYESLANLVKDIKSRYPINYIVGHSDIAPDRKTDPWLFDWQKFNGMIGESDQNASIAVIKN
jgi:N-acetyl-anhydromuramyl-L-alanine amidase AmpD